ncbi:TetR/AcrR family transcriptional regulator [Actinokineospora sp. PR83]|uniref:TetR/AcrR family transcriptional regulator n=1 Tax=Actinokineospora sp. PR83 TaxID=2884908 RepID=UPI001F22E907|nr:TetR/AcrR family transcriptional regulator [Actinokineospora sp. PR83]MCG8917200.1 TetR/AcrR family transcriptional regulator [Actinokineospora sp. PR83]
MAGATPAEPQAETLRDIKKAEVKQQLVRSARELASVAGYDATTVAQICRHARVGTSTFFRYFPEKQSVFLAPEVELWDRYLAELPADASSMADLNDPLDHVLRTAGEQWAEDFAASLDLAAGSMALAKHSFDHCVEMETTILGRVVANGTPDSLVTHMRVGVFLASWRIAQSRWRVADDRTISSLVATRCEAFELVQDLGVVDPREV